MPRVRGAQQLPTAGDDEFYWVDLIGLDVVNRDGICLGQVEGLMDERPQTVLRVQRTQSPERLIPFVAAHIDHVDHNGAAHRRRLGRRLLSMRFDVITLFPELFEAPLEHGITRRAWDSGAMRFSVATARPPRMPIAASTTAPYGGGPGMVMLAEPLQRALTRYARNARTDTGAAAHFAHAHRPDAVATAGCRAPAGCCCAGATKG